MSKRRTNGARRALVWVPAGVAALLAIKWVLITVVVLAGPCALWWCLDRAGRSRRGRAEQALRDDLDVAVAVAA